jgi:hypothetical protein
VRAPAMPAGLPACLPLSKQTETPVPPLLIAGAKDKDKGASGPDGVFTLSHPSFELKVDETQELTLYAFPTAVCLVCDQPHCCLAA